MNSKVINTIISIAICLVSVLGTLLLMKGCVKEPTPEPTVTTDTVYHTDTLTIDNIKYKYIALNHYDTTYLTCIDTLIDSVLVEVPIYDYEVDTTIENTHLRECIQGYNVEVNLVEIETTYPEVTTTIVEKCKPKRWGVGFQAGFGGGYDVIGKKAFVGPYIGVGLSYNFLLF